MFTAYQAKQYWLPKCAKLSNLCIQSKNGLLNWYKTINLHAVGIYCLNVRENGFGESTDKKFRILEMVMSLAC